MGPSPQPPILEVSTVKRAKSIVAAIALASVAATPITADILLSEQRNHVHKLAYDNVLVPSERLSDLECEDGQAGPFACSGIDLLSFVPDDELLMVNNDALAGGGISDIWGWEDRATGDEYVLFGKTNGTAIYRVTDPTDPVYVGEIPNTGPAELIWHDIKINDDYAYIVSETPGHGVQVFDLRKLRNIEAAPTNPFALPIDTTYMVDGAAHNIVINEDTDMAYLVGSGAVLGLGGPCRGGLHAIDIRNPLTPIYAGCHTQDTYIHDAQCAIYEGPDAEHQGKEICVTSNEDSVSVVDVSDMSSPTRLSTMKYPGVAYSHQGWMSEDQQWYFHGDELDENGSRPTRTFVFDLRDLDAIRLYFVKDHAGVNIDHNMYTHQGLLFQSNYTAGLRVFDTAPVVDRELPEVAFFDTYPNDDKATFNGTWSNYPYFRSGTIAVSGIGEGLFLLRLQDGIEFGMTLEDDDQGQDD